MKAIHVLLAATYAKTSKKIETLDSVPGARFLLLIFFSSYYLCPMLSLKSNNLNEKLVVTPSSGV